MKPGATFLPLVKKGFLYAFIVFLSATAFMAIVVLLFGSFGAFQIKILFTSLVITFVSVCSLCCSIYISRKKNTFPGIAGVLLAILSGALLISGMWMEIPSGSYWKMAITFSVFAVAAAHVLALRLASLRATQVWMQTAATITIFTLAAFVSLIVVYEVTDRGIFKILAVLAVLVALQSLVIPLLSKVVKIDTHCEKEVVWLKKRSDGMYEDEGGCLYHVSEASQDSSK